MADKKQQMENSRVQSVLEFASHLQKSLDSETEVSSALPDPSAYLKAFPLPQVAIQPNRVALDRKGTQLWNLCRKFGWYRTESESQQSRGVQIRALAFFMIESAQERYRKAVPISSRLVHLGLVAAKCCLYYKHHELASQILERVALCLEGSARRDPPERPPGDHDSSQRYPEYICLRIALSWQQDRLDLAEHFFTKVDVPQVRSGLAVIEDMVDLFFEIGRSLLHKDCCDVAVVWLKRARELLQNQDLDSLSPDAGELRMNLLHTYVRALHCLRSAEAHREAIEIVDILLRDYGNKLAVRLLQLDIISEAENPNSDSYHAALNVVSVMIHLTEQNLSMIFHFAHRLRQYSAALACRVLQRFLLKRLVPHGNEEWITKTFITLLWMSTIGADPTLQPSELGALFGDLFTAWKRCLCPEATHGALVLLWKHIEDNFQHARFRDTIGWCQLALHKLLEKAGDVNVDKIERRLVQCYLEICDLERCKVHVSRLVKSKIADPFNHYLAYCLALKTKDAEGARGALTALNRASLMNEQLLYACISKTLESGTPEQAANILHSLLDKYDFDPPKHISLPTLLRCTVRLYLSQLTYEAAADQSLIQTMVRLFTAVPEALERRVSTTGKESHQRSVIISQDDFSITEINWFLINCYNLAVKVTPAWPTSAVVSLFDIAIQITAHRTRVDTDLKIDALLEDHARRCLCHFAIATICVAEGRQCPDVDSQVKCYCKALTSAAEFDKAYAMLEQDAADFKSGQKNIKQHDDTLLDLNIKQHDDTLLDLNNKRQVLLPLEFEAAMQQHLHVPPDSTTPTNLDRLSSIISKAQTFSAGRKTYALFADIVLSSAYPQPREEHKRTKSGLPFPTASTLIIDIITTARTLPDYDTNRASRWIRCLVQLCLDQHQQHQHQHHDGNPDAAGGLLPQVSEDQTPPLQIVEDITTQAISLSRQSLLQARNKNEDKDNNDGGETGTESTTLLYPAEEIEWLSTTLFNLGIDFYLTTHSHPNHLSHGRADNSSHAPHAEAKKWTSTAVEIADVLAEYPREEGGDRGLLGRVLRGKISEGLGWLV